jgi:hypothetical protein
MNAPLHLALAFAVVASGPVVGCDGGSLACTDSCGSLFTPATFELSCGATSLTNVAVSGPCATDASAFLYSVDSMSPQNLYVASFSPGVCHVELTFATGFTYSTDVTFMSMTYTGSCCGGTGVVPTPATLAVKNPSNTCVDAGPDAGASETPADASTDALDEDAVDAPGAGG